jgi:hypothetical protein
MQPQGAVTGLCVILLQLLLCGLFVQTAAAATDCRSLLAEFTTYSSTEAAPYKGDNMVYFLHIPRTAGRTFHTCLLQLGTPQQQRCNKKYDQRLNGTEVEQCHMLSSHDDFSIMQQLPPDTAVVSQVMHACLHSNCSGTQLPLGAASIANPGLVVHACMHEALLLFHTTQPAQQRGQCLADTSSLGATALFCLLLTALCPAVGCLLFDCLPLTAATRPCPAGPECLRICLGGSSPQSPAAHQATTGCGSTATATATAAI